MWDTVAALAAVVTAAAAVVGLLLSFLGIAVAAVAAYFAGTAYRATARALEYSAEVAAVELRRERRANFEAREEQARRVEVRWSPDHSGRSDLHPDAPVDFGQLMINNASDSPLWDFTITYNSPDSLGTGRVTSTYARPHQPAKTVETIVVANADVSFEQRHAVFEKWRLRPGDRVDEAADFSFTFRDNQDITWWRAPNGSFRELGS